jgi:hypothetical protein
MDLAVSTAIFHWQVANQIGGNSGVQWRTAAHRYHLSLDKLVPLDGGPFQFEILFRR